MNNEFNFSPDLATKKLSDLLSQYSNKDLAEMLPAFRASKLKYNPDYSDYPTIGISRNGYEKFGVVMDSMAQAGLTLEGSSEYLVQVTDCMIKALDYQRQERHGLLDLQVEYEILQLQTLLTHEKTKQAIAEMEYKTTVERLKTDWSIFELQENLRFQEAQLENQRKQIQVLREHDLMTQAQRNELDYAQRLIAKDSQRIHSFWARLLPFIDGRPRVTSDSIRRGDF